MLIKFFPNGKGAGAGPVGHLVAESVLAYDSNRDLIRDAACLPLTVTRNPLPEVLRDDMRSIENFVRAVLREAGMKQGQPPRTRA